MAILRSDVQDPQVPLERPPLLHMYFGGVRRFHEQGRAGSTPPLQQLPEGEMGPLQPAAEDPRGSLAGRANIPAISVSDAVSDVVPGSTAATPGASSESPASSPVMAGIPAASYPPSTTSSRPPLAPRKFNIYAPVVRMFPTLRVGAPQVPVTLCAADDNYRQHLHFRVVGASPCIFSTARRVVHLVWGVPPFVGHSTEIVVDTWYVRAVEPDWVDFYLEHDVEGVQPAVTLSVPIAYVRLPLLWRIYRWLFTPHILRNSHPRPHLLSARDAPCAPDGTERV